VPVEVDLALDDVAADDGLVVVPRRVGERRHPAQHLEHQYPEGPVVHALVVALAVHELGREVLWRAADGEGAVVHDLKRAVTEPSESQ
jgi:hypothetical protein